MSAVTYRRACALDENCVNFQMISLLRVRYLKWLQSITYLVYS